ncbi:transposase [Nostoc sp. LEGE 12450]|uniref:transposase n=1 Tax=Nostoc sp. LEGE 12450 TaxID=1828643 RepID=UPI00187E3443|nr:transposase [Nostoc sp. LEGE 12450]
MVVVDTASIQDCDGAKLVFDKIDHLFPKLHLIWADAGYAGSLVDWVRYFIGCRLEIIKYCDLTQAGLKYYQGRWVVERTLAWLGRYRRLSEESNSRLPDVVSVVKMSTPTQCLSPKVLLGNCF